MAIEELGDWGYECMECRLRHSHAVGVEHDYSGMVEKYDIELMYDPRCHCGVQELTRLEEVGKLDLTDDERRELLRDSMFKPAPEHVQKKINDQVTVE